jgi:hypothetical protein
MEPEPMSQSRFIQTLLAAAFGMGFLVFGIFGFVHVDRSERRIEAKLHDIQAGMIQPDTLTVLKKYVSPGRGGLPHIIFGSMRQPRVNVSATKDYFNSVNLGQTVRGYYFSDGYFIPENHAADNGAGKWFFLFVGVLVGGGTIALAIATNLRTIEVELGR